jgi:segregation and condensation protein B
MNGSLFINKTYSRNEIKGLLEAILFVNGKSITIDELHEIFETAKEDVLGLIEEWNQDDKNRNSGFAIVPVAGGYQLFSNPHFKDELTELFGKRNENKLPKTSLETLAIIAYKQPISKEEIDKIRGVSSTRSINTLLMLKLITISGSADDIVKSPIYSVTSRFLEFFRIQSIEDLPSLNSIEMNHFLEDFNDDSEESDDEEAEADSENNPPEESIFNKN